MNKEPLVSIFIPVYNREAYIEECLESVVNQSYLNLEIVILDDGSTDNTLSIIAKFKDPRIKQFKNDKNRGITYSRSRTLELITGDYLALVDSDDIIEHDRIEKQMHVMLARPEIAVVGSNTLSFGDGMRTIKTKFFTDFEEIKCAFLFETPMNNSSTLLNASMVCAHQTQYNPEYIVCEDYDFFYQISKYAPLVNIKEPLVKYRLHEENVSRQQIFVKGKSRRRITLEKIQRSVSQYYSLGLSDEEQQVFSDFFIQSGDYDPAIFEAPFINELQRVTQKMKDNNHFCSPKTFSKVFDYYLIIILNLRKVSLKDKLMIYKKLNYKDSKIQNAKMISYFVLRDLYHNVRGIK